MILHLAMFSEVENPGAKTLLVIRVGVIAELLLN
jgi:hypothetical protein